MKKKFNKKYKKNDKFFVFINSNFNRKGKLSYGEVYLPGKLKEGNSYINLYLPPIDG